jgi:hypothetical protein
MKPKRTLWVSRCGGGQTQAPGFSRGVSDTHVPTCDSGMPPARPNGWAGGTLVIDSPLVHLADYAASDTRFAM